MAGADRQTPPRGDSGFTLIELLVAMVIFSVLAAVSTSGWSRYQQNVQHRGSAQELVSALRNAQQAALAEAVTYCVAFDATTRSYQVNKFTCSAGAVPASNAKTTNSVRVGLSAAAFVQPDGTTTGTVSFFPRGSATRGTVDVTRTGSARTYRITVEGLTGRVFLNA